MIKADGTCRIDSVTMGEVTINTLGQGVTLVAKYALTNSETKERYGAGNRNTNWSESTLEKLSALVEAMETDIVRDIFVEGATTGSVDDTAHLNPDGVPGL